MTIKYENDHRQCAAEEWINEFINQRVEDKQNGVHYTYNSLSCEVEKLCISANIRKMNKKSSNLKVISADRRQEER